ncbi:MAG: hypothetical protein EOP47_27105 [Sphingobacteriaceae bacterium]|nr:MAG: hypothetical protein EOP47_27105 [Sphingobacteriaceae bacterium]
MKKLLLIICCLFANVAMAQTPDANGILYVDISKTGGTGSSWGSATKQLADALVAAKSNPAITQIWVAGGTYKPLYSPADNNFGNADGKQCKNIWWFCRYRSFINR